MKWVATLFLGIVVAGFLIWKRKQRNDRLSTSVLPVEVSEEILGEEEEIEWTVKDICEATTLSLLIIIAEDHAMDGMENEIFQNKISGFTLTHEEWLTVYEAAEDGSELQRVAAIGIQNTMPEGMRK